ncbi:Sm1 [Vararia minispora EC-137]|uniref:Sm1 n=1 Tax=Vararia minispora EC-137 TaxID=1314806 RepID=A0ACB8QAN4_9AGAM|nr:Sm1 [Vararia minispora EC-137]
MKFAFFSAILALAAAAAAATSQVRYDNTYDNAKGSLDTVACSNGPNGIETRYGYKKFGDLPTFPNIGAASAIAGYNSPACGSCWKLTYGSKSIIVTAIDHAGTGFNIAEAAMNTLTGGHAVEFGVVNVTSTQVAANQCGL